MIRGGDSEKHSIRTTVATLHARYLNGYRSARSSERDFMNRSLREGWQHDESQIEKCSEDGCSKVEESGTGLRNDITT